MIILGIDPGYAIVGFGVIKYEGNHFTTLKYGAVTTPAGMPFGDRLSLIFDGMNEIFSQFKIDAMSIEKLYFNTNTTTVIMLSAQKNSVAAFEYTPLQVKQSVTGYGRAEKKQIMEMTRIILGLEKVPKPDDTADALALALCHAHWSGSMTGRLTLGGRF